MRGSFAAEGLLAPGKEGREQVALHERDAARRLLAGRIRAGDR